MRVSHRLARSAGAGRAGHHDFSGYVGVGFAKTLAHARNEEARHQPIISTPEFRQEERAART